MIKNEGDLQAACIRLFATIYPALWDGKKLFHIPNGGSRNKIEAARLKSQGVVSGVWDIFLSVPVGGYSGLYIEMKFKKNGLTPNQKAFRESNKDHYAFAVCYTQNCFLSAIQKYLSGTATPNSSSLGT